MKNIIPLFIVLLIYASPVPLSANFDCSTNSEDNQSELLLDLFYGMEYDENAGTYTDTTLDTINGLKHVEICELWHDSSDETPIEYEASVGIYIDTIISPLIWEKIEQKVDSQVIEIMSYHEGIETKLRANNHKTSGVNDFIKKWQTLISAVEKNDSSTNTNKEFYKITPVRACSVIHKVYEDKDWETYLIQLSYSTHGSNGCPSYSDYISFNKHDGHALSFREAFEIYDETSITEEFSKEFSKAKVMNGYESFNNPNEFTVNWNDVSGIAFVQNGLLIYYKPYVIGGGAEGQYNINIKIPNQRARASI